MRYVLPVTLLLCALPALAQADSTANFLKIFGRDPGVHEAHACFVRRYSKAYLASHSNQNVADMLVYVSKSAGEDPIYGLDFQVHFKHLNGPFQSFGSCLPNTEDKKTTYCGIDCDGGSVEISAEDRQSFVLEIPNYARVMDPKDADPSVDLPAGAEFLDGDKQFLMERTSLKDCLPLIYDESIKAQVSQGALTE